MLQALILSSVLMFTVSSNLTSGLLKILVLQRTEQPKLPTEAGRSCLRLKQLQFQFMHNPGEEDTGLTVR